ncbi:MAG: hypothetical protein ACI89U_002445, partial [Gammaproteobacteria bacterium]
RHLTAGASIKRRQIVLILQIQNDITKFTLLNNNMYQQILSVRHTNGTLCDVGQL